MMRVQVLIATMNQKDHSLLDKMKINSEAIVGNQCDRNSVEEFNYNGHKIKWLSFNERGVGLNRNNALMRADGDICLFADDDMEYVENYSEIIAELFNKLPKADVIIFNLLEKEPKRYIIKKITKINRFNYLRYGTARVAIRLDKIKFNGIYFNQCFGGGTSYCHGEDNLFLTSCLNNKLKIYAVPIFLASLKEERESTWDKGYNDKYLHDQGKLYLAISKKHWKLLCLQDAIRRHKAYNKSIFKAYKAMVCKQSSSSTD